MSDHLPTFAELAWAARTLDRALHPGSAERPDVRGSDLPEGVDRGCDKPPPGWCCTRPAGHDGPCAAAPIDGDVEAVRGELVRIARVLESLVDGRCENLRREKLLAAAALLVAEVEHIDRKGEA